MADINGEIGTGVYGKYGVGTEEQAGGIGLGEVDVVGQSKNLPVKAGFWSRMKNFWLQDIPWNAEIKVELTPYQQKVEKEVNDFLHQEITWGKIHDFLFQEIKFGKKNK